MPEKQNIEYKRSWHDDYLKWVCGFANAVGGKIYIGKDDDGNIVHLEDYKQLMESIPQKIRNTMGITCDVNLQEAGDKKYIETSIINRNTSAKHYKRVTSNAVENFKL